MSLISMYIGYENYFLKNFKKAMLFTQKGIEISKQSKTMLNIGYQLIGLISIDEGNYEKAHEYYLKKLAILEKSTRKE